MKGGEQWVDVWSGVKGGRGGGVCSLYRHGHGPSTARFCHIDMVQPGWWWLVAVACEGVPNVFARAPRKLWGASFERSQPGSRDEAVL